MTAASSGIMPTGRLNRQNTQIEENVIEQLCGSRSTHWVRPFSSARLLSPRAAKLLIPMSSSIAWSRPIPLSLCYSLRADSFLYCSSGSAGDPCRDIAENDLKGKVNDLGLTVPICFLSGLHFYHLMEGQRKDLFFIAMYAFSQAISLAVCSSGPASMPVADGQPAPELPTREDPAILPGDRRTTLARIPEATPPPGCAPAALIAWPPAASGIPP